MAGISVIVPLFNVEEFVSRCIESLKEQTFEDFEVVCVDDGSTDRSLELARAAAAGDGRFRFVQRANGGLSAARNTGLENATGDYVCFLDSDDWYRADALELLHARAVADDLDVLDFSAHTFYETARARKLHREDYDFRTPVPGIHAGQDLFARYWALREYVSSACFHLVRRSLLENAGLRFEEGLLHEDELFTPMVYAHADRAAFLREELYCRRMREGSIMSRPRDMRNVRSLFSISQILHAWLIDHAAECKDAFVDALAQDIAYIRDAAFMALQEIDGDVVEEYVRGLDVQQRVEFDLTARFVSDQAHERCRALEESRTYRTGEKIVALPRALRDIAGSARASMEKK